MSPVFEKLNIVKQCRNDYNVSVWRCPNFLFILMGLMVVASIGIAYFISNYYSEEPEITALLALVVAGITFVIGHIIVHSFTVVVEANHLKSQFLNIASHQLLTPLTALKWSSNSLLNEIGSKGSEKQKEMIGIIQENNNKMIDMVTGLLDISRMENGTIRLNPEKFDLAKTARDLAERKSDELMKKQNKIEFSIEENIPCVMADQRRTRIAMENLVNNSIQYSRPGETILVSLKNKGDRVMFEISDKGIGIPERASKYVFGKFYRAPNVSAYQQKGLGLGLFLTKFIIEASGGEINFESKEGIGSKFWFSLPAVK